MKPTTKLPEKGILFLQTFGQKDAVTAQIHAISDHCPRLEDATKYAIRFWPERERAGLLQFVPVTKDLTICVSYTLISRTGEQPRTNVPGLLKNLKTVLQKYDGSAIYLPPQLGGITEKELTQSILRKMNRPNLYIWEPNRPERNICEIKNNTDTHRKM